MSFQPNTENPFIVISGLIGVGKTTLSKKLSLLMNLDIYQEPVEQNEYLIDFYNNMAEYSFPLQISLLNYRFNQHQYIIWSKKGAIQDRSIYEDKVFSKMLFKRNLMKPRDYKTYLSLFENMSNFLKKPNLLIYLHCTPEESLERIKLRGRGCEKNIDIEYLKDLYNEYEIFIKDISKEIPVLKINFSSFGDHEIIAQLIRNEYSKMTNIKTINLDNIEEEKYFMFS